MVYREGQTSKNFTMVSFRRDQLRAILLGVMLADAVTQGQVPLTAIAQPLALSGFKGCPLPGNIPGDRWCHFITQGMAQFPRSPLAVPPSPPFRPLLKGELEPGEEANGMAPLLATLPFGLPWLADSNFALLWAGIPALAHQVDRLMPVYGALAACLRGDQAALREIAATTATPELSAAIAPVLRAKGDFYLTLGLSTQPGQMAGVPLLSGLFSGAWVGSQGLPAAWLAVLSTPESPGQHWLQARWQIPDLSRVETWTSHLWNQWIGRYDALAPFPASG